MRLLLLHNRYLWPGGEDSVVADEAALLRAHGHEVHAHYADNGEAVSRGRLAAARALLQGAWSSRSYECVRALVADVKPEVVHAHNLWFTLSPSVLAAAHDCGCAVLLTLHNFRLLCPGASLMDGRGRRCQDCLGRSPWRGIMRRCYHGSFLASATVARMIAVNRMRGTWEKHVDLFATPSEFCREIHIRGGISAERIVVKPNFVVDPLGQTEGCGLKAEGAIPAQPSARSPQPTTTCPQPSALSPQSAVPRALFIGRLSREKGLKTLLTAWPQIEGQTGAELRLIGQGPLEAELRKAAEGLRVTFAGQIPSMAIQHELRKACVLVLPSECYETFGRAAVEAFAMARPVVVSDIGGQAELVRDGTTGLLFKTGSVKDLVEKLALLLSDAELRRRMGQAARAEYLARYTPERNYEQLMTCYRRAIEARAGRGRRSSR